MNRKYNDVTELVRACQRLDPKAQTIFYDRYKSELTAICSRYAKTKAEAEDIYQESFIKVFNNLSEVADPNAIDAWIKSIVVRTAINYYHRTTKNELRSTGPEDHRATIESDDYERIIETMRLNDLRDIISKLPDGYRIIINLHLIDGYSHVEIAEMLNISDSTSRSQFYRGRNLLIRKLQQYGINSYEIP